MPEAKERFAHTSGCAIVAPEAVKIEAVNVLSSARKVSAAWRIIIQYASRNRTAAALMKAASATARSFGHVAHQLWLEVTGTVFLAMAAFGGIALARECIKYHAGQATSGRVAIAICFTLAFAWFGISSFWKVRKKS